MKALKVLMMLICLVVMSGLVKVNAASIPISIEEVQINGVDIAPSAANRLDLEVGEDISLRVKLTANADADNVQIEAFISGYEYSDFEPMSDSSHVFDVEDDVTYIKTLKLKLPEKAEKDNYKLRLIISDRYSDIQILNYNLLVDLPRHKISVKDVWFTPEDKVMAGEYLIASVRLQNYGNKDESGIKVEVSIPELGVSAVDYIDELEADDSISSEELYLKVPKCNVKAGNYEVKVKVTYDDGYEMVSTKDSIVIGTDGSCTPEKPTEVAEKLTIALESNQISLEKGAKGAVIPVTITYKGTGSKTLVFGFPDVKWATFKASPSNVVTMGSDETKTVYVYVSANADAVAGSQSFGLTISNAEGQALKQLTFNADVTGKSTSGISTVRALEIALVVLIIILVLIGLIIGFRKLMGSEESTEEATTETYY
jgi:hypothetical protein